MPRLPYVSAFLSFLQANRLQQEKLVWWAPMAMGNCSLSWWVFSELPFLPHILKRVSTLCHLRRLPTMKTTKKMKKYLVQANLTVCVDRLLPITASEVKIRTNSELGIPTLV